ncbi:MAG: glycosyltransferase family 39 protein [Chloroflexota bacterium]
MTKLNRSLLSAAILLLAFTLRVAAIDQIPPGLSHDEAYNGVTAMQVLHGQRLIFFEINKGIEPLIIYLEALAFYAFGIGPVQLRLVNIFCGLLTVALVYPLAARLFNRRLAWLAMAGVAVSFWAIFVSRLTLRAVTLPPLLLLTLYWLWRGLEPKTENSKLITSGGDSHAAKARAPQNLDLLKLIFFALSGLAAGATMYTYLSSRFAPLLALAVFGYQLIRRQIKDYHWPGLLIHLLIWAALLAPLAHYFWQNAASFTERSNQVSTLPYALNGDFGPMTRHTLRTLGMFTVHGDETDRYNLDGRPVFDWINGLFFYLGVGVALLRLRRAGPAWLLLWFFVMLLPAFITDDSPHFLRTIGALPAAYILWAGGVEWALQQIDKWATPRLFALRSPLFAPRSSLLAPRSALPRLAIPLLLLLTTLHTGYDYFIRWAAAPNARAIYGADMAAVARYLKTTNTEGLAALSAEYYQDLDPFRLALHFAGNPPFVIWFDGRQSLAFPPPESGLSPRYIFAASAPPADLWLPLLQASSGESNPDYSLYRLPPAAARRQLQTALFSAENSLNVNLNNDLLLTNYQVLGEVVSGGKFRVLLGWQALRPLPPGTDYTFLVRMWDNQGHLWVEDDGNGFLPVNWQPGVQGLQLLTLRLPGDLPPRTYHLTAEVVDRRTGQALPTATGTTATPLTSLPGALADTPRPLQLDRLPNPRRDDGQLDRSKPALRGYKLNRRAFQAGDTLSVTLHWQVLARPQENYRLEFRLHNDRGPVYRWSPLEPIGGEWPTRQWPAAYWVQDQLDLSISPAVPAGQFLLRVDWVSSSPPSPGEADQSGLTGFELGSVVIESQ